jgi:FAD:protein FMN transferase
MKQTRLIMGMPVTLEVLDPAITPDDLENIFAYFVSVDEIFSTYKATSEISQINRGELLETQYSEDMKLILALSEQTKKETLGYFDIQRAGIYDPSGIVKGWAVHNAANMLKARGFQHFYLDAGGDIQVSGQKNGNLWRIGIRNPFNRTEHVKILALTNQGIATSGTAIRGQHIYNPHDRETQLLDVVSITIVGPNVYEADRFATAALDGFEGYMIDKQAIATFTSGFERYVLHE